MFALVAGTLTVTMRLKLGMVSSFLILSKSIK